MSAAETLSAILTVTPADVPVGDAAVSPELQRIVRKCLVKDAEGAGELEDAAAAAAVALA